MKRLINAGHLQKAVRQAITHLRRWLNAPLGRDFAWLAVIVVLNVGALLPGVWLHPFDNFGVAESVRYTIGALAFSIIVGYVVVFIRAMLPRILSRVWWCLCMGLMGMNALVDAGCFGFLQRPYDRYFIRLIAGTNAEETNEFFSTYFSFTALVYVGAVGVAAWGVWRLSRRLTARHAVAIKWTTAALIAISLNVTVWYISTIGTDDSRCTALGVGYKLQSFSLFEREPNIEPSNVTVVATKPEHPLNVVVIIGESLAKYHCSTMGYDHPTQPHLQARIDADEVIAFTNVKAPHYVTGESFKRLMGTYWCRGNNDDWWRSTNIIEVARKAGYRSIWVSNQNRAGAADNLVTRFAEYADTCRFTREHLLRDDKEFLYDETLLPILTEMGAENNDSTPRLWIVHLYGNHFAYSKRYPESFAKFSADDYPTRPEHQRTTVAEYDNSVLYNDYVVDSIISLFATSEAVVIYFPDHGEDIYRTYPDYAGHSKNTKQSRSVGAEIPMYIYMSPSCRKLLAHEYTRLQQSSKASIETNNFIYTFLNIIGYKIKQN